MREIGIKLKKARKNAVGGADVISVNGNQYQKSYWLITLYYGKGACGNTSYLKKCSCKTRRKRYLNVRRYIKCLNHEIMHAVLWDVIGKEAWDKWDNVVKRDDGVPYRGRRYGWKNIIGKHLPGVYCADD